MATTESDAHALLHSECYLGDKIGEPEPGQSKILIAFDGSAQSERAVDWYIENVHRKENYVVVAHGMEIPVVPTRNSWDEQMATGNKKKQELYENLQKKFKEHGITGKFVAEFERAGEFIINTAEKEQVVFIVMGTRGLGKIRRTIMGSVSDYVVHHAHCPIIVTRHK